MTTTNTTSADNTTWTMEDLQEHTSRVDGAVLKYGDRVLVADSVWTKEEGMTIRAWVYQATEEPITGFGPNARGFNECALTLIAKSEQSFQDAGHAIAWAMTQN